MKCRFNGIMDGVDAMGLRSDGSFPRILLAVDRGEDAASAVSLAARLAARDDGEVVVFHVWERELVGNRWYTLEPKEDAEQLVRWLAQGLRERGVRARAQVCRGTFSRIPETIVESAAEEFADLIVMGAGSGTRLRRGIAERTVRLSHVPVMLTGRPERRQGSLDRELEQLLRSGA